MRSDDIINIYWSPLNVGSQDWSMLYPEPENLYSSLIKNRNSDSKIDSFLSCPASKELFKKTYQFKNSVSCKYEYGTSDTEPVKPLTEQYLNARSDRKPSINTGPLIKFSLSYIFFSESPVIASFTSPHFTKPRHLQYGSVIPGEYDIGKWFRPYNVEMQMWNSSGVVEITEDEPLFYVKFNTDKNIKLHRFSMNSKLMEYAAHCTESNIIFGLGKSLSYRYNKFTNSRMNNSVLKEIKQNILGEQ